MGPKSDVVVKVVFMFFVTLLSFSVGTFVGKKYSDNQYQLAALEPQSKVVETQQASVNEEPKTEPGTMTDADIAELAEEFMTEESTEVLPVPAAPDVAAKVEAPTTNTASTTTETARQPTSVPKAAATPKPQSLPSLVGEIKAGQFTVQVASYDNEKDAQTYAQSLKTKGYTAYYIPADVKGKTYYRVSVGQFNTRKEAEDYRNVMIEKAVVTAAIVQKVL